MTLPRSGHRAFSGKILRACRLWRACKDGVAGPQDDDVGVSVRKQGTAREPAGYPLSPVPYPLLFLIPIPYSLPFSPCRTESARRHFECALHAHSTPRGRMRSMSERRLAALRSRSSLKIGSAPRRPVTRW